MVEEGERKGKWMERAGGGVTFSEPETIFHFGSMGVQRFGVVFTLLKPFLPSLLCIYFHIRAVKSLNRCSDAGGGKF